MGIVTVITSGKGGVGKSTVAAGLGAALERRGRRVLLIDMDAGLRSLDFMLGVSCDLVYDLSDVVTGNCEPSKAVYPCGGGNGLFLLPAPQNPEDVVSPDIMTQLCRVFTRYYDHILIDCPAGLGRGFQAAIAPAQRALVISTPDPLCLRGTDRVRRLLEDREIPEIRLVVNRFQAKNFFRLEGFEDLDAVIDACGIQLIAVIPEDFAVARSAVKGIPVSGKSAAAKALHRLSARLEGEDIPLGPL